MTPPDFPLYRSLRPCWAVMLGAVSALPDGGARLVPADSSLAIVLVDAAFVARWAPLPGGYYVVDDSGCELWCSDPEFEANYQRIG